MISQTRTQTPIFNDLKGLEAFEVCVSRCKSVSVCKVQALKYASRRFLRVQTDMQIVSNKKAPPVRVCYETAGIEVGKTIFGNSGDRFFCLDPSVAVCCLSGTLPG